MERINVEQIGLEPCGQFSQYGGLVTHLFFSKQHKAQVSVTHIGTVRVVKAAIRLKVLGQGPDGRETLDRDLSSLFQYLRSFPEVQLVFSSFSDMTPRVTPGHKEGRRHARKMQQLQRDLKDTEDKYDNLAETQELLSHNPSGFENSRTLLKQEQEDLKEIRTDLKVKLDLLKEQVSFDHELERFYQEHGHVSSLIFLISSALYCGNESDVNHLIESAVGEILHVSKYSLRQRLSSSLQIYVEPLKHSYSAYLAESVGLFSPVQLERLAAELPPDQDQSFIDSMLELMMVSSTKKVSVKGHRKASSGFPARAFRELIKTTEVMDPPSKRKKYPKKGVFVGRVIEGKKTTDIPYFFSFENASHTFISGGTRAGKSFLARALVEGALEHNLIVLILDPRGQWIGLLLPEDRPEILRRYKTFDMNLKQAKGFKVKLFTPDGHLGEELPTDIATLGANSSLVSFKGLEKAERCTLAARILEAVFEAHTDCERPLSTLIVIEEAHLFTTGPADEPKEKQAASKAESAINLIGREGAKYGSQLLLISQSIRDFSRGSSMIRQNSPTRFWLRNADRELQYAAEFLENPKQIPQLKQGEVIITGPDGEVMVKVRPPFSKVQELDEQTLRKLFGKTLEDQNLTKLERKLLQLVIKHMKDGEPVIKRQAMQILSVTSGRQQGNLIQTLVKRGLLQIRKLSGPGNPQALIPTDETLRTFSSK